MSEMEHICPRQGTHDDVSITPLYSAITMDITIFW